MSRFRGSTGGFTLVELIVVLALTSVVTAGITSVVISMLRTEARAVEISDTLAEARAALTRTQNELRQAKRLYPDPDTDPTLPCEPRELSFWVDENSDGLLQNSEHVTYALEVDGTIGQLVRWTAEAPTERRVLARHLENADVFTCTPAPPDTRVIEIDIVVEGSRGLHTTALDGSVRLRNVD